jgi:predicted enzyme related to lactoylglutathione lyase
VSVHFDLVTIDSPRTDVLATFWAAVLGLTETEREDGDRWIVLSSSDGVRRIGLQRGEHRTGTVHLDLACGPDEFAVERDRILALGATETRPPRVEHYGSIANFVDLDGNLFDLCAYTA